MTEESQTYAVQVDVEQRLIGPQVHEDRLFLEGVESLGQLAQQLSADSSRSVIERLSAALQTPPPAELAGKRADALSRLLDEHVLEGLYDARGRSLRALAVKALLSLGYPYAMYVAPEDLLHFREEARRLPPWGLQMLAAGAVGFSGVHLSSAVGTALAGSVSLVLLFFAWRSKSKSPPTSA